MRLLFALSLALALPLLACAQEKKAKKPVEPIKIIKLSRTTPVLFDKDIEPILADKCSYCHSGNVKEGKFDLGSYESLMKGGRHGQVVVPGKVDTSLLIKLAGKTQRPYMPPRSEEPLTPEELALLKLWIEQGAKAPTGVRERPKVILAGPPANVTPVLGVAVSPDKTSVAASRGSQIHIYNASTGAHLRRLVDPQLTRPDKKPIQAAHLALVDSLAYSPDGKTLASGAFQEVILWDPQSGVIRKRLTGFADRVVALAFSHEGKLLATGGGAPTQDGEIKVFEADTGKLVTDIKNGHSDTVFGVSFRPGDKVLATCAADKFVKTFEIPSGKLIKTFEGHTHHVLGVGWKGDGKLLASGGADNSIKVWDFDKGEQVRTIQGHGKQITSLQFIGKTEQFVTCSGDQSVRFWNADNGGNTRNFGGASDFLYAVGVSPDGAVVAVGGQEGVVRLYNGTNGQLLKTLVPPEADPARKPAASAKVGKK